MNTENSLFVLVFMAIIAKPVVRKLNAINALRRENEMLKAAKDNNA